MLRAFENFEYRGEFEKDFRKCWLYCVWYLLLNDAIKGLKTDYENLVHVTIKVTKVAVQTSMNCATHCLDVQTYQHIL
jgi:hypothetical protein